MLMLEDRIGSMLLSVDTTPALMSFVFMSSFKPPGSVAGTGAGELTSAWTP